MMTGSFLVVASNGVCCYMYFSGRAYCEAPPLWNVDMDDTNSINMLSMGEGDIIEFFIIQDFMVRNNSSAEFNICYKYVTITLK